MTRERKPTDWCILRTAAASTLRLATSLTDAGMDVWTPRLVVKHRRPRSPAVVEREAPILPTFVFARERHLDDLARLRKFATTAHPSFSIFTYAGEVPLIREGQMAAVRAEEHLAAATRAGEQERARLAAERKAERDRLMAEHSERQRLAAELRAAAPPMIVGTKARVPHVAFTGMVGEIEQGKGRKRVLHLGGGLRLTIEAWQVDPEAV